jgi:UDP-2,3-diacylglucosamine pyrophosphatase LpxH
MVRGNRMGKIVVMSDIHFGRDECNLSIDKPPKAANQPTRKQKIDDFFQWLDNEQQNIDEFIFIGDIFDLHLSNFQKSTSNSFYFFEKLSKLKGIKRITYIPGNHDHTFWLLHIYFYDLIKRFQKEIFPRLSGDLNFVYDRIFEKPSYPSFLDNLFTSGNKIKFSVTYPGIIRDNIAGKKYAFFHGHFLDKEQRISEKFGKLIIRTVIKELNIKQMHEFELFCSPQYEAIALLSQCAAGRIGLNKINETFEKWRKKDYRKPVYEFKERIKEHIYETGWKINNNPAFLELDYVIFGHTHYAGIGLKKYKDNPKLITMNTGSWVGREEIIGEFIVIDKDKRQNQHPQLYEYKWRQPTPVLNSQSELLNFDELFQ